ncbi:hypothetical protein BDR04DRAFT_1096838 [Suillus decipiens]|nr:hypothetical protein BDR04DRAFT_1096838 [Suillus decipiens]
MHQKEDHLSSWLKQHSPSLNSGDGGSTRPNYSSMTPKHIFSDMGSTQSSKRCNLSVDTFEALAKIRANLRYHTHQKAVGQLVDVMRTCILVPSQELISI